MDLTTTPADVADVSPPELRDTRGRVDATRMPPMGTAQDAQEAFDPRRWCACHTIELADDETRPDATDDTLVHGAVVCVREATDADAVAALDALAREVGAAQAIVDLLPHRDRRRAAVDALALVRDVLADALDVIEAGP